MHESAECMIMHALHKVHQLSDFCFVLYNFGPGCRWEVDIKMGLEVNWLGGHGLG